MLVWILWQNHYQTRSLEGVFDSESKAQNAMTEMEADWRSQMLISHGEAAEDMESPFVIESEPLQ